MTQSSPNYAQLAILEALEFHTGVRARRPASLDSSIVPACAQLRLAGGAITWAAFDSVRELVRLFAADHGEESGVAVPFSLALHSLTASIRNHAFTAVAGRENCICLDDALRLRDIADELDMQGHTILMKHPEGRYWDALQQPGDFGRAADFETLLEWWHGRHITQMGFIHLLLPLVSETNVEEIMARIPVKLEETFRLWAAALCESYSRGEKIYVAGREGESVDLAGMPALCSWIARQRSDTESDPP